MTLKDKSGVFVEVSEIPKIQLGPDGEYTAAYVKSVYDLHVVSYFNAIVQTFDVKTSPVGLSHFTRILQELQPVLDFELEKIENKLLDLALSDVVKDCLTVNLRGKSSFSVGTFNTLIKRFLFLGSDHYEKKIPISERKSYILLVFLLNHSPNCLRSLMCLEHFYKNIPPKNMTTFYNIFLDNFNPLTFSVPNFVTKFDGDEPRENGFIDFIGRLYEKIKRLRGSISETVYDSSVINLMTVILATDFPFKFETILEELLDSSSILNLVNDQQFLKYFAALIMDPRNSAIVLKHVRRLFTDQTVLDSLKLEQYIMFGGVVHAFQTEYEVEFQLINDSLLDDSRYTIENCIDLFNRFKRASVSLVEINVAVQSLALLSVHDIEHFIKKVDLLNPEFHTLIQFETNQTYQAISDLSSFVNSTLQIIVGNKWPNKTTLPNTFSLLLSILRLIYDNTALSLDAIKKFNEVLLVFKIKMDSFSDFSTELKTICFEKIVGTIVILQVKGKLNWSKATFLTYHDLFHKLEQDADAELKSIFLFNLVILRASTLFGPIFDTCIELRIDPSLVFLEAFTTVIEKNTDFTSELLQMNNSSYIFGLREFMQDHSLICSAHLSIYRRLLGIRLSSSK